ncbi:hypothetical protein E1176_04285 [Fulvivirga sp. RKSG066]|uniref:hypothetical protein n=1 Tax=Fulvivirga aurantia TaxID=2529383 RepID=UPI0012BB5836|nr:hypothetical protein [Fulvivirga aurantia]MTI20230.1 hypothetical protein [Fulvivirga aurantia]
MLPKILLIFLLCSNLYSYGQIYLGFTGDIGNRVEYSPRAEPFLKRPAAPSGSLSFFVQENINDTWSLQYGGSAGTLGYWLKLQEFDTLSTRRDPDFYSSYPNYNTIYTSAHLVFGRSISFKSSFPDLAIYLGGGFTYYFRSEVGSSAMVGSERIFDYEISRLDEAVKGFMEISTQIHPVHWIMLGLRYRHHFQPALKGTYNLYHVENPPSGEVLVTQRTLSLLCFIKTHW